MKTCHKDRSFILNFIYSFQHVVFKLDKTKQNSKLSDNI